MQVLINILIFLIICAQNNSKSKVILTINEKKIGQILSDFQDKIVFLLDKK
jgi:hypothetical protein